MSKIWLALVFRNGIEFDQDLATVGSGYKEEVDASTVSPRAGLWIDRHDAERLLQHRGRAIEIYTTIFHLLNSFAKSFEIAGNRSFAIRISSGQNIQGNFFREMKLIFFSIHVRGNDRQARDAVRLPNAHERIRKDCEPNGDERLLPQQTRKFPIGKPRRNNLAGQA